MPAEYKKMGIEFLYPENWTLDEEAALAGERSVSVHSPGGGFWSITLYADSIDPRELALTALNVLKAEYPDCEAEPASETIGRQPASGYDLSFFYLDFTNTAIIRSFRNDTASCLVLYQAEDREFAALAPVFRAITASMFARPA